jgi:hypothetical protein
MNFIITPNSHVAQTEYCGVFTSCKKGNIETSSHDYATVDEAVFLRAEPSRAEPSRAEPSRA